uniref:Uncharacterized protein n=1 Tax=Knipowitschia caucasica TaxID=637954 RepID=A0AAV2LHY4_KNICA
MYHRYELLNLPHHPLHPFTHTPPPDLASRTRSCYCDFLINPHPPKSPFLTPTFLPCVGHPASPDRSNPTPSTDCAVIHTPLHASLRPQPSTVTVTPPPPVSLHPPTTFLTPTTHLVTPSL